MKKSAYIFWIQIISIAVVLLINGCGNNKKRVTEYSATCPTEADSYEGATGDNNISTASTIAVGEPLQERNIYPQGDSDWVKIELVAGTKYELFTTNLNEKGDTYLGLYDENGIFIAKDDDYIDYDSHLEYNATYSGTYYLKIRSYSVNEITSYQLGVREYMDTDSDGYTPTYDCNDNNDTIYPFATEIPGDGIDQDCSGVDALDVNTSDSFEADDQIANAKAIPETMGSYWEIIHRSDIYSQMRTLPLGDMDFYRITVPAFSAGYVIEYSDGISSYDWYAYDENGTQVDSGTPGVSEIADNDTGTAQTYYFEVRSNGSDIGWYAPAFVSIGEDRDGDGYYTCDWSADCNDNNASINPGAGDSNDTDGIDMNCDGIDGYNSDYTTW